MACVGASPILGIQKLNPRTQQTPTPPRQAVPLCFVGTVERLEAVVALLCSEMAAAFRQQGLAVPPWRSEAATLSKWAPPQLAALAAKIAGVRRAAAANVSSGHAAHHLPVAAQVASGAGVVTNVAPCAGVPEYRIPAHLLPLPASDAPAAATALAAEPVLDAAPPPLPAPLRAAAAPLAAAGAPLRFTRKASAEWKAGAAKSGKKVKSLLAAALRESCAAARRSGGGSSDSESDLSVGSASPPTSMITSSYSPSPAAVGATATATAAASAPRLQCRQAEGPSAAAATAAAAAAPATATPSSLPAIRTIQNEAGCGRITTVRWGAFQQQLPSPAGAASAACTAAAPHRRQ